MDASTVLITLLSVGLCIFALVASVFTWSFAIARVFKFSR